MKQPGLKRKDFAAVYKKGRQYSSSFFSAYCLPGEKVELGVVASKKVGNAIQRNRAKRLLREALRQMKPNFNSGAKLILSAKPEIVRVKEQDVQMELKKALKRFLIIR